MIRKETTVHSLRTSSSTLRGERSLPWISSEWIGSGVGLLAQSRVRAVYYDHPALPHADIICATTNRPIHPCGGSFKSTDPINQLDSIIFYYIILSCFSFQLYCFYFLFYYFLFFYFLFFYFLLFSILFFSFLFYYFSIIFCSVLFILFDSTRFPSIRFEPIRSACRTTILHIIRHVTAPSFCLLEVWLFGGIDFDEPRRAFVFRRTPE